MIKFFSIISCAFVLFFQAATANNLSSINIESLPREQATSIKNTELSQESFVAGLPSNVEKDTSYTKILQEDSNVVRSLIVNMEERQFVPDSKFMYADTKRYTILGEKANLTTKIKPLPAILLFENYSIIFYIQHVMQQNTIWKKVGPFHIMEDAKYTFYLDKAGHFFGTYLPSYVFSEAFLTAGFSWDMSTLIGAFLGLCYTSYVEVLDGCSVDFGFSPTDFYADIAGAGYFVAQHYIPYLQNFTPKFQYAKPSWHSELDRYPHDAFIDNYSTQIFWMSANVHNMLPDKWKKYWPSWLEISFGYSVYSLFDPNPTNLADPKLAEYLKKSERLSDYAWGNPKFIVALDYNLVKLIPDSWNFLNWLRQTANFFKLPAPAIEFGRHSTKFYLFYPIEINLGNIRF